MPAPTLGIILFLFARTDVGAALPVLTSMFHSSAPLPCPFPNPLNTSGLDGRGIAVVIFCVPFIFSMTSLFHTHPPSFGLFLHLCLFRVF